MSIREVQVRDASGKELHVLRAKGDVANFGRDKRICHVAFDPQAARVSRVHASIEWTDEGVVFTDKSKEGTVIDGTKLKQFSKNFDVGVYQIQIGGIGVVVEVEGNELDETVMDSQPPSQRSQRFEESVVEESVRNDAAEEVDEVSSISTFGFSREKTDRKRKSDVSLFDDSEPRGKRGPVARKPANIDEEMENRGKKGPRARKAAEKSVFEEEAPAKRMKPTWEPVPSESQRLATKKLKESSVVDPEDVISAVTNQIAAIPSVSSESDMKIDTQEQHFDRGPGAPNETIKYANLIFRPSNYKPSEMTMTNSNVPNFKKFKPKNIKDGRVSVASIASNKTFHTTISLIDARRIH